MLIYLIVISKRTYCGLYPFHICLDCVFCVPLYDEGGGERGVLISVPFLIVFCTQIAPPDIKKVVSSENFSRKFRPQKIDLAISQTPS